MEKHKKLALRILSGIADKNIPFSELCELLKHLGFQLRIKGDHYIFYKEGVNEIINLQPHQNKAKPYQVKQTRNLLIKYKLIK